MVQALGEDVSGIIVTGTSCGFGTAKAYWSSANVPILVIAGTKDDGILGAKNSNQLAAYCRRIRGAGRLRVISVPRMGHLAAIWWPEVNDAIAKFLNLPHVRISRRTDSRTRFPTLTDSQAEEYRKAKRHKALASDTNGKWYWDSAAESPLDAEESTLFGCDEQAGFDAFADASHHHTCVLVDVNGKRLVK